MITQARLKELITYDSDTGFMIWVKDYGNRKEGTRAGSISRKGYMSLRIDKKLYFVHRLIWLFVHGTFPSEFIDHIDGNKSNNRLVNLRAVSRRENSQNLSQHRGGKKPGCYYNRSRKKWEAQISINNKKIHLGMYLSEQEAHAAYVKFLRANNLV